MNVKKKKKKKSHKLTMENGVCMLAHSILIDSSSNLLVTREDITSEMSSYPGQIRLDISELSALEVQNTFSIDLQWNLQGQFVKLAGIEDRHEILG